MTAVLHEGTEAEVLEYQAREAAHVERLANHFGYRADAELMTPTEVIRATEDESTHYAEHTPTRLPIEIEEAAAIPTEGVALAPGENVEGLCNVYDYQGERRVYIEVTHRANPVAVLHEMAHALDIEDGHGASWVAHHEALIAERFPDDPGEPICYQCAYNLIHAYHDNGEPNPEHSPLFEKGGPMAAPRH